jgi:hypothetical protein
MFRPSKEYPSRDIVPLKKFYICSSSVPWASSGRRLYTPLCNEGKDLSINKLKISNGGREKIGKTDKGLNYIF